MPVQRSSRACQACRTAKIKCEVKDGESSCRRCELVAKPCVFPASRRGRIKGSKNLRTLQKLLNRIEAGNQFPTNTELSIQDNRHTSYATVSPPPLLEVYGSEDGSLSSCGPHSTIECQPQTPGELEDLTADSLCQEKTLSLNQNVHSCASATSPDVANGLIIETVGSSHNGNVSGNHSLGQISHEFPVENYCTGDPDGDTKGLKDPLWLLAELAERSWNTRAQKKPKPLIKSFMPANLTSNDAPLLSTWTPHALQGIMKEQIRYYKHGLLGSKCDVAASLDPIQCGFVTEKKAAQLFTRYWELCHPQWTVLDPTLHSMEYVRQRSALLMTTILAIASTVLSKLPSCTASQDDQIGQVAEATKLHEQVEKLILVVYATGARSIDIIQAHILLSRWGMPAATRLEEKRWMRAAMFPRMAMEIGLNLPRRYNENLISSDIIEKSRWNDIRTRGFMILNEHRFFTFSGRSPMDLSQFEYNEIELNEVRRRSRQGCASSLAALYSLFLFDRDVRRGLEETQNKKFPAGYTLDAEMEHIKTFIEDWIQDWCPPNGDLRLNWHLKHDAISCWLLLIICVARKRSSWSLSTRQQQQHQQLLLALATQIIQQALDAGGAVHTTHRAAIFPVAASIVLRLSSRTEDILRLALRMTGDPRKAFVPTFARESGSQMLIMVCTTMNSTRPSSPLPHDKFSIGPSGGEPEYRASEATGQADGGASFDQHEIASIETASMNLAESPSSYNSSGNNHEQSNPCPQNGDAIFSFNISDFPHVPDPTQPQVFPDDPWLLYTPTEIDERLGTNPYIMGLQPQAQTDDRSFGSTLDPLLSDTNAMQILGEDRGWDPGLPNAAQSSTFRNDLQSPREILLAASDRLMQLAYLAG